MTKEPEDLTGKEFGKLTVLTRVYTHQKKVAWRCVCSCGNIRDILGFSLKNGGSRSCGCVRNKKFFLRNQYKNKDF